MSGLFPIVLHITVLLVFFEASRLWNRLHLSGRYPGIRAFFFTTVLTVLSGFVPALHSISLHAAAISIAAGYLDHFYFIFYAGAIMLLLAGNPGKYIQTALICALALYTSIFAPLTGYSDISADRIFTLKAYTQNYLSSLDSECRITWFRSGHVPRRMDGKPVAVLLDRITDINRKHITYAEQDPATLDDPAFAERLGVQPFEDSSISAIMIEYHGKRHLYPAVSDFTMIEYEIARFFELCSPAGPPRLPLQMLVLGDPAYGYEQLQTVLQSAGFTLIPPENPVAGLDAAIPLIVIGSRYAEPFIVKSIDNFIEKGGNAVFFVSGVQVAANSDWSAQTKTDDPLLAMLKGRGVEIPGYIIRDKNCYTIIMPALSGQENIHAVPYPLWPRVSKRNIPSNNPLFSGISDLQFFWPSPVFTTAKGARVLLSSGKNSELEHPPFVTHPFDLTQNLQESSNGSFSLGVSLETGGRILVIPDEYTVSELTDFAASYDNFLFFANCAEWISGREAVTVLKRTPSPLYAAFGRLLR